MSPSLHHVAASLAETELRKLLLRDWATRVLDAWAWAGNGREHATTPTPVGEAWCVLREHKQPAADYSRRGESPDAARLAAAEAVINELPESVRAELGERS